VSPVTVLATTDVWLELLEVVVIGSIAGIAVSTAFALLVRGVVHAGAARRDARRGAWISSLALTLVSGTACVAAVVFAVYEIVSG
jgi:hypothetical protein